MRLRLFFLAKEEDGEGDDDDDEDDDDDDNNLLREQSEVTSGRNNKDRCGAKPGGSVVMAVLYPRLIRRSAPSFMDLSFSFFLSLSLSLSLFLSFSLFSFFFFYYFFSIPPLLMAVRVPGLIPVRFPFGGRRRPHLVSETPIIRFIIYYYYHYCYSYCH